MAKGAKTVAKAKAAGIAASSGKSRKAEDAAANPFSGHDKLSPDEVASVLAYQGYAYQSMNAYLRGVRKSIMSDIHEHIPHLDRAIAGSTLAGDVKLYRGVQAIPGVDLSKLAPGHTISDLGFHSTSTKMSVAEKFIGIATKPHSENSGAMFTIKAAKGKKALAVHQVATGSAYSDPTGPNAEHEVLLPRGSTFKVERVSKRKDGNFHITLRLQ